MTGSAGVDFTQSHRRYNPLTRRWVQVSPHRLDRPWQGEETEPEEPAPPYDAGCYLCPGNARKGGDVNPDYEGVFVFDNDFSAIPAGGNAAHGDGLFRAEETSGVCRVICFSPDHSKTLPLLSHKGLREVVDVWAAQTQELGGAEHASVQIFENKGAMMGCSNPHPHGQIWATRHIPNELADAEVSQAEYFEQHDSSMLLDLVEREWAQKERVVEANDHWLAIVPFWAAWPFETLLLPRVRAARLPDLAPEARDDLAAILKSLTTRYDNLFKTSFPYSMGWHQAPFGQGDAFGAGEAFGEGDVAHFQLHAHFYPPLLRSASVRKFMVGYEMLAEPQRDLTPERAAETLRSVSGTKHYSQSQEYKP